jgi:hypothetical protein
MAIPESQLTTWASQGSVTQSANTYATIKNALESTNALYNGRSYEVFLQGSYGNYTNIFAESDVDVVIRLTQIWRSDLGLLSTGEQNAYHETYPDAKYTFSEFKSGAYTRLTTAFGQSEISSGDKAFHIKPNQSRRSVDVVTCHEYRRYIRFNSRYDQDFVPGIIIPNTSVGDVINYPKAHSENLTGKNKSTQGRLKPTIRIFKNARNRLIDDGVIADDSACSYYIEGMLYNVPDENFVSSHAGTFYNCVSWLQTTDRFKLLCANRQYLLLGNSNVQWPAANCDLFLDALADLWNNWY